MKYPKKYPKLPNQRAQRGFAILESIVGVALFTYMLFIGAQAFAVWLEHQDAQVKGVLVAQYNSAVASWINAAGAAVPTGNYNGIGWLQNAATCAGATGAEDFLPCGFDGLLSFGLQFNTQVDTNATDPAVPPGRVRAVTNLGTPRVAGAAANPPLMAYGGALLRAAQAYVGISQLRAQNLVGLTSYRLLPDPAGGPNDQLIAQVDTSVNVDPWLRTDGSNQMLADLNVGGNDVVNSRDVNASRNVNAGQDTNTGRDVNAANNVSAGNDLSAGHNISALGGQVQIWANAGEGAVLTLTGANGERIHIQNINGMFRLVNSAWNAELMHVDQSGNLVAGRDISANGNNWGGDVKILNSANEQGTLSLAQAMQSGKVVNNNGWVDAPTNCPPDYPNPKIFAVAVQFDNNGNAEPIGAVQVRGTPFGSPLAGWTVTGELMTPNTNVPSPATFKILTMTACGT
jgi:type II secretory pathway pseudopilin PulG